MLYQPPSSNRSTQFAAARHSQLCHSQRCHSQLCHSQRRGAVTVELALTIGLAFFFFFAALELSRVAMLRHTIENAVYEGARVGALPGGSSDGVKDEVQRVLRIVGVRNSDVTTSPETIRINTPDIEVSVRVPLSGNLYFPPLFFKNKVLERTFKMQRETQNVARAE